MPDSLFGSDDEDEEVKPSLSDPLATLAIPNELLNGGLEIHRDAVPPDIQHRLITLISQRFSFSPEEKRDQVMLWGTEAADIVEPVWSTLKSLPVGATEAQEFFNNSSELLQVILNAYAPGSGISPHVDLPHRYGSMILGISLLSSTVMIFRHLEDSDRPPLAVLLRPGDVYVLSRDARYHYTHEIPMRFMDKVCSSQLGLNHECCMAELLS